MTQMIAALRITHVVMEQGRRSLPRRVAEMAAMPLVAIVARGLSVCLFGSD